MSIYGKFLAEFTPGSWDFNVKINDYGYTAQSTLGSFQADADFSSGDGPCDVLTFLGLLTSRLSTHITDEITGYGDTPYPSVSASVFPETMSFNWVDGPVGSTASTTQTFEHSTLVIAVGGWADNVASYAGSDSAFYLSSVPWVQCSDDLLAILGFDETETVQSNRYIVATSRPRYCWFPGVGTYGATMGAGITSDSGWVPVDAHSRIVSGGGNVRITGPSRLQYTRRIRFEALKRSEVLEMRHRGPIAFLDQWATSRFRWYPDRDVGTVGAPGTRGDPGPTSYHTDSNCGYWYCALASEPRITQASDPNWFTVTLDLNGEPA